MIARTKMIIIRKLFFSLPSIRQKLILSELAGKMPEKMHLQKYPRKKVAA